MTDTEGKSACTVRVTVKLRPEEYDELFRHVREIGSTMSAFFRESAARAMKEEGRLDTEGVGHTDLSRPHGESTERRDHSGGAAPACLLEPGQQSGIANLELSRDAALAKRH